MLRTVVLFFIKLKMDPPSETNNGEQDPGQKKKTHNTFLFSRIRLVRFADNMVVDRGLFRAY